jgi:hypothetical protein
MNRVERSQADPAEQDLGPSRDSDEGLTSGDHLRRAGSQAPQVPSKQRNYDRTPEKNTPAIGFLWSETAIDVQRQD